MAKRDTASALHDPATELSRRTGATGAFGASLGMIGGRRAVWSHELRARLGAASFNYHFNISLRNRYLYVEVPKSAATTLKSNFGRHEMAGSGMDAVQIRDFFDAPHRPAWQSPFVKPYQLTDNQFEEIVLSNSYTRFSFVRNPFSRAASAYLDKILGSQKESDTIRAQVATARNVPAGDVLGSSVTFVEFLQALRSIRDPLRINAHFRPQASHLLYGEFPYELIGHLESFDDDLGRLLQVIGINEFQYARHPHRTDSGNMLDQLYADPECVSLVQEVYAEDFRSFGYSPDSVPG